MTTNITLDTIVSALREAGISGHCLMSTMDDGPRCEAPGLAIHWDDQDPNTTGWWVREAVRFDPTTGTWDGVREDSLDTAAELAKLVERAAVRYRAMEMGPVTDADIAKLRDEAGTAGDLTMAALCAWALGETRINHDALLGTEWAEEGVTRDDARTECERVIREARASR